VRPNVVRFRDVTSGGLSKLCTSGRLSVRNSALGHTPASLSLYNHQTKRPTTFILRIIPYTIPPEEFHRHYRVSFSQEIMSDDSSTSKDTSTMNNNFTPTWKLPEGIEDDLTMGKFVRILSSLFLCILRNVLIVPPAGVGMSFVGPTPFAFSLSLTFLQILLSFPLPSLSRSVSIHQPNHHHHSTQGLYAP
jgi:hypothetical protein